LTQLSLSGPQPCQKLALAILFSLWIRERHRHSGTLCANTARSEARERERERERERKREREREGEIRGLSKQSTKQTTNASNKAHNQQTNKHTLHHALVRRCRSLRATKAACVDASVRLAGKWLRGH
jgi:hypothetical protein